MPSDSNTRSLRRIFIANRGEIARRIALTAKRLGIETVAIMQGDLPPSYLLGIVSDFVSVQDESTKLYLDSACMIELAKIKGCDALHPGFGFLSENAAFAAAVQKAGLIFIGPNPSAIEAMASKGLARQVAEVAGVPLIRGLNGFPVPDSEQGDFEVLENFAASTSYPLLIKAAYGGGGKGMRIVRTHGELRSAAWRARSEALSSFGDGALIVEQYLEEPRHIEVQILADKHGQVLAVGDRDCSLQRRHQKIIEEAPAPGLSPETRAHLHRAAIDLAKRVGYDSTGTVEFLLDWSKAAQQRGEQKFYFLEMNTRLQVEHPVSEEIFQIDLVEWQIRVAAGERLPAGLLGHGPKGHSVEVRVYAEDPENDFFPAPGAVAAFRPEGGPGIRWEIGVDHIDEVTGRFDPMIAKLIATAADRRGAMQRLAEALDRSFLAGPANNTELLAQLARSSFAEAPESTPYLARQLPHLLEQVHAQRAKHQADADAILDALANNRLGTSATLAGSADHASLTALAFGYGQNTSDRTRPGPGDTPPVAVQDAIWQSASAPRRSNRSGQGYWLRSADGKPLAFWYASHTDSQGTQLWVKLHGYTYTRVATSELATNSGPEHTSAGEVTAPVPGRLVAAHVKAGQSVQKAQPLFVLESMKMEFEVKASRAGTIAKISTSVGEQVTAGQVLATYTEDV